MPLLEVKRAETGRPADTKSPRRPAAERVEPPVIRNGLVDRLASACGNERAQLHCPRRLINTGGHRLEWGVSYFAEWFGVSFASFGGLMPPLYATAKERVAKFGALRVRE